MNTHVGIAIDGQVFWNYSPRLEVESNVNLTHYPPSHVHYIAGKVEETLTGPDAVLPEKIALLRLDTDFYESTKVELDVLVPRLVPGGVLQIDD